MELTWPLGSRERGPSSESILVPIGRWWVCLPSELLGPGSAHWGVSGHLWLSSVQYCYPLPKPIPLSLWLLVQILLCGLFTLTSGLCWSTDHLGTSASSLGIWEYLEPQDTRSENTLGPMSLDIVLSYCLLLCVVDEVSQTCSLTWLCLWELAPSLMCPGSLTPHPLFCPLTWELLPTSASVWRGLPQVIFYSFPEVAFTLPPSLGP